MIADYFRLALNSLRRRRLRSWLTMIGIFIGIAAVVGLISLGQGLQEAITGQFGSLSVDILTIQNSGTGFGPPGSTVIKKLDNHDIEIIGGVSGIEHVISRWIRTGTVKFNKNTAFGFVIDLPKDKAQAEVVYSSFGLDIRDGKRLKNDDHNKVMLGDGVASSGTFEKKIEVGNRININGKDFEVVGIMKKTSNIIFNGVVVMTHDDLGDLFKIEDEIDMIIVKVSNPSLTEEVAEDIKKVLRKDRNEKEGEETFSVATPIESLNAVNNVLVTIKVIVVGIALISLIVGGIGIANTMYTSVLERRIEIGTMKSIGAKNSDILWIFLIESGLLGLVGGLIGVVIGLGISFGVAGAANTAFGAELIAVSLDYGLIGFSVMFAFIVGIVSGAIPSYQASKLRPVEALRG